MHNLNDVKNRKQEIILKHLNRSLTYENSTILMFAGYGMVGYAILLMILNIVAILYTPYLLKTLYTLNKTKWIIAFFIMVGTPLLLKFIFPSNIIMQTILSSIPLFMFYLFCWILKFSVSNWLEDIKYADVNFDED